MNAVGFIRKYREVVHVHSRRSPRTAELRALQEEGLRILRSDEALEPANYRKVTSSLASLSMMLADHSGLLSVFDDLRRRGEAPTGTLLRLLTKALVAVSKLPETPANAALRDRFASLRDTILEGLADDDPDRMRLQLAGKSRTGVIEELGSRMAGAGSETDATTLLSLLVEQAEMHAPQGLAQALEVLDQHFDAISASEGGPALILWLSVVASAKEAFEAGGTKFTKVTRTLALERVDRTILDPLPMFRRMLAAFGSDDEGRFAFLWSLLNRNAVWGLDYRDAPELRWALFNAALDLVERRQFGRVSAESVCLRLFRRLGQCERFWTDAGERAASLARMVGVLDGIPEPTRGIIRAYCHLAADEQEAAAALFNERAGPEYKAAFSNPGHVTFITSREAATYLDRADGDERYRPERCGFSLLKLPSGGVAPTVVASADPVYLARYAKAYADSLFRFDAETRVHFHILGRGEDVAPDLMDFLMGEPRISLTGEQPPVRMAYYYATARFLRLPLLCRCIGTDLLLTDIDTRFFEAPAGYFARWRSSGDVGLRLYDRVRRFPSRRLGAMTVKTPKFETWTTLNAAAMYFGRNERAMAFATRLSNVSWHVLSKFQDSGNSNWWIDQNIMFATLRAACDAGDEVRLFNLIDTGIPFGIHRVSREHGSGAQGQHPAMPRIEPKATPDGV